MGGIQKCGGWGLEVRERIVEEVAVHRQKGSIKKVASKLRNSENSNARTKKGSRCRESYTGDHGGGLDERGPQFTTPV